MNSITRHTHIKWAVDEQTGDSASGVRRPASGVRRPASGVRRPASGVRRPKDDRQIGHAHIRRSCGQRPMGAVDERMLRVHVASKNWQVRARAPSRRRDW
jgi:hypothetical protein